MNKIETFINNNVWFILSLGVSLNIVRYGFKKLFPQYAEKIEKYYRLFICSWVILMIGYCILQKEYILAIFIPIFGLAIIYYLKEIVKESRHKK